MIKNKFAFTLIEVLLAFLLLTILMLMISKFFLQSKLSYNKLSNLKYNKNEMSELFYDLKKIIHYNDIHFTLETEKIYFLKEDNNRIYYTEYFIKDEFDTVSLYKKELLYPYSTEDLKSVSSLKIIDNKKSIEWYVLNPLIKDLETQEESNEEKVYFKIFKKWTDKNLPQMLQINIDENKQHKAWLSNMEFTFDKNQFFYVKENKNNEEE